MADFSVSSTTLSDPQGQGAGVVAPVQEHDPGPGPITSILSGVTDIFAKGLAQNRKEELLKRQNAVVGEYVRNEGVYGDAMTSGQWNPSQTATASRANFQKFIAAYPEYAQELHQARGMVYGGTEIGEAQKKIDADQKQRETDVAAASAKGFVFYSGMSDEAKDSMINANKAAIRVEDQFKKDTERAAETRAQSSEKRSETTFNMSVDDHVAKERAAAGVQEVAGANFDSITTAAEDLRSKMASGAMSYEQALAIHNGNISRIKTSLLAVANKNPELAAPWTKLFDDIDNNIKLRLDPKTKSADDLKLLDDKFSKMITTAKIVAIESNPRMLKAVTASELFKGDPMVTLFNSPTIKEWVLSAGGTDTSLPSPPQLVGTQDDNKLFSSVKSAISKIPSMPEDQKLKATMEANNIVNTLLKQTTNVDGKLNPAALKEASTFYASTEFGRMSLAGQIDKQTASNAQHVFQVQYDPAVKSAIQTRLEMPGPTGVPLASTVNVKLVGSNVVFENNLAVPRPQFQHRGTESTQLRQNDAVDQFKGAEAGLNQLIRMHAHLEGTTDYAKYWETHKHELMPTVFPDPNKLKPGQVENGHKYIGGNYRDPSNWIAEPTSN